MAVADIGFAIWSWKEYRDGRGNLGWALADSVGALPGLPSAAYLRRGPQAIDKAKELIGSGLKFLTKGAGKVANMDEFFKDGFGENIKNSLLKTKIKYDGQSIYKVTGKNSNEYLKKGYGVYLDALHKDHLEVINKVGEVKYVLNLDGTMQIRL